MTGFLDLPGEVRNRIYAHIFPEQQVLLRCTHPRKAMKSKSRSSSEVPYKYSTQLYAVSPHDRHVGQLQQQLLSSAHLLRVSRKIHEEALPLLYTSTSLHFESMKAINCFLNRAPTRGVEHVTKLAITQSGYGEPYMTSNTQWKAKHDQRWMSTCKRIAKAMTGIRHLKLSLEIRDWPTQLDLGAKWAKPLFFMKGPDGLDRVDVYLCSIRFLKTRLDSAARTVESAMMSDRGRAQRQLEQDLREIAQLEEERQFAKRPMAEQVLSIKMHE